MHKVRFVASTLLDAVRKAETAPASAARAHAYLCERCFYSHPILFLIFVDIFRGLSFYPVRNRAQLLVSICFSIFLKQIIISRR